MTGAISQYERAVRILARIERPAERSLEDYEDECWCFFQNCWHLKDWIKYDDGVEQECRDSVEKDADSIREIRICADLANRSKHLTLTRSVREDARVSKTNTIIHAGELGSGYGEYAFKIQLADGTELDALDVARSAVDRWRDLLLQYGVSQ